MDAQTIDLAEIIDYINAIHRGLVEASEDGYDIQHSSGCWDWSKVAELISLRSWAFGNRAPDEQLYSAALLAYKAQCRYVWQQELL